MDTSVSSYAMTKNGLNSVMYIVLDDAQFAFVLCFSIGILLSVCIHYKKVAGLDAF